jgi:hypothetical protein
MCQEGEEHPTNNKKRKSNFIGSVLLRNSLLKRFVEEHVEIRMEVTGKRG